MVETAVVTLTCPQCGGQIHGVAATNQDQTVPCTYCGTELHIPKIGGDVIHERVVVVEQPATAPVAAAAAAPPPPVMPAYVPPIDTSLQSNTLAIKLVVGFLLVVAMVIFLAVLHSQADDDLQQMQQRDQARQQCQATCTSACKADPKSYGTSYEEPRLSSDDDPEMRAMDDDVNAQLRESYVLECQTSCEQQKCGSL